METENTSKEEYIPMWVDENQTIYDLLPMISNYGPSAKKKFGHSIKKAFVWGDGFNAKFFMPKSELRRVAEEGYNFYMDKKKVAYLLKEIKRTNNIVIKAAKKIAKIDLKKLSNEELDKLLGDYGLNVIREALINYIATQPHHIPKLERELKEYLTSLKVENPSEAIQILTTPKKRIIFIQDGFFSKSFTENLKSEEVFLDKEIIFKKNIIEENLDQKERIALEKKLKLPPKIKYISRLFGILGYERLKMRTKWMMGLYYNEMLLQEVKRRFNISREELKLYFIPEISELTLAGKKVDRKILEERKISTIVRLDDEDINVITGKKAFDFLKDIESSLKTDIKEFRGQIACRGYAKGRAIIFSNIKKEEHVKKMQEMQKGQILVSEMTHPNIMPACEKAGAIVTEEGGLLCHAAIVSREMKKPCVIGTRIATRVLKDGDLVEVDADKGIIRKL